MKMSLFSNTPLTDKFLPSDFPAKPIPFPMEFLEEHLIQKENLIKNTRYPIMNKLKKVKSLILFKMVL